MIELIIIGGIAAGVVTVGAMGLGVAAVQRVGSAYRRTIDEIQNEQMMADYYNRQAYHSYHHHGSGYGSSRRHRQHYYR